MKFSLIFFVLFSCAKKSSSEKFSKIVINEDIQKNDTIKLLSKYPELQNVFRKNENDKKRSAYILQTLIFNSKNSSLYNKKEYFDNYISEVKKVGDTLEIALNNNNGYFGNGILIKCFNGNYFIKNFDPNVLHNKQKLVDYELLKEKLILNRSDLKKGDSIFGFINYTCKVRNYYSKNMTGYFKSKID